MRTEGGLWDGAEVISTYSRKQAIEDGVLVVVPTELAREAGFKFPIALTAAAWVEAVETNEVEEQAGQSVTGRLWDILVVLHFEIKRNRGCGTTVCFKVHVAKEKGSELVSLKSVCGPGDDMEPVITLMLPEED